MLVKVLIRRRLKEGKVKEAFSLLRKIRTQAMHQNGYISGETFIDHDDPQKTMVIGTWQSMEDWTGWKENPKRKEMDARLENLIEGTTEYEAYVYSKFYLSVSSDNIQVE